MNKLPELNCFTTETVRLTLKACTPDVYKELFEHYTDHEIKLFLGLETDEAFRLEKQKYQAGLTTLNRSFIIFLLINKNDQRVLGSCGFHNWYTQHKRAELGYHLFNEHDRRKGYMSEAFKPIIQYGFSDMNLNRMEAFISPLNEASIRLVRQAGFMEEGCLREHYMKNDVIEDSLVFGLLKSDFLAKGTL